MGASDRSFLMYVGDKSGSLVLLFIMILFMFPVGGAYKKHKQSIVPVKPKSWSKVHNTYDAVLCRNARKHPSSGKTTNMAPTVSHHRVYKK